MWVEQKDAWILQARERKKYPKTKITFYYVIFRYTWFSCKFLHKKQVENPVIFNSLELIGCIVKDTNKEVFGYSTNLN